MVVYVASSVFVLSWRGVFFVLVGFLAWEENAFRGLRHERLDRLEAYPSGQELLDGILAETKHESLGNEFLYRLLEQVGPVFPAELLCLCYGPCRVPHVVILQCVVQPFERSV